MTTVAYLTHPIGERDAGFGADRGDNVAAASEWFRFLKDTTRWAICCPWFAYLAAVDSDFYRRSWITDQCEILSRCDVLVLVGGYVSPHMRIEADHARNRHAGAIPVLDLIDLGRLAPWRRRDEVGIEIRRRATQLGVEA